MTNNFRPGGHGSGGDDGDARVDVPPGDYVIGLVWFKRKEAKSGSDYLNAKFEICGPATLKGSAFFTMVSLDTTKSVVCKRLELWMENIGQEDEVDLDSDADVARVFKGKAFKAKLKTVTNGKYKNVEIDRFAYVRDYSPEEDELIEQWEAKFAERGWEGRDPTDPGHAPGDAPQGKRSEPQFSKGSSFDDDDIPF